MSSLSASAFGAISSAKDFAVNYRNDFSKMVAKSTGSEERKELMKSIALRTFGALAVIAVAVLVVKVVLVIASYAITALVLAVLGHDLITMAKNRKAMKEDGDTDMTMYDGTYIMKPVHSAAMWAYEKAETKYTEMRNAKASAQ